MSNKKQTSVEWFFDELQRMQYFIGNDMLEAYKQAKELHRQEIMDAYRFPNTLSDISSEQYYKDTYETNN